MQLPSRWHIFVLAGAFLAPSMAMRMPCQNGLALAGWACLSSTSKPSKSGHASAVPSMTWQVRLALA